MPGYRARLRSNSTALASVERYGNRPDSPLLRYEEVTAGYAGNQAVVGPIDAEARAGELVALVGPNGAGKSTLLRAAIGGEVWARGEIQLCGRPVSGNSVSDQRRRATRLAWVPQAGGVRFGYTVAEVLAMARHPHGDAGRGSGRAAVSSAVDRCDLSSLLDRPFPQLSGGQQRRVLVGRALVQASGGAVVLADEPTAGVDPGHADATLAILRKLAAEGFAVVVTLHDLTAAWRYADRVWLLDRGLLSAAGTPEEVLQDRLLRPVYGTGFERVAGTGLAGAARGGAVLTCA